MGAQLSSQALGSLFSPHTGKMMNLLTEQIEEQIQKNLMENFIFGKYLEGAKNVRAVLDCMYTAIPAKKRISHGRYTTIKVLAEKLFEELVSKNLPVIEI